MPVYKLYFKEIDWVLYLASHEREGQPDSRYRVTYHDRFEGRSHTGRGVYLDDVLGMSAISDGYPHTVCLFRHSFGRQTQWEPRCLETRRVRNKAELIRWVEQLERVQRQAMSQFRYETESILQKVKSIFPGVTVALGWIFVVLGILEIYLFVQGKMSLGDSLMDIIIAIALLPAVVVLFPVYAAHEGSKITFFLIYGLIFLGVLMIILGSRIRKKGPGN